MTISAVETYYFGHKHQTLTSMEKYSNKNSLPNRQEEEMSLPVEKTAFEIYKELSLKRYCQQVLTEKPEEPEW